MPANLQQPLTYSKVTKRLTKTHKSASKKMRRSSRHHQTVRAVRQLGTQSSTTAWRGRRLAVRKSATGPDVDPPSITISTPQPQSPVFIKFNRQARHLAQALHATGLRGDSTLVQQSRTLVCIKHSPLLVRPRSGHHIIRFICPVLIHSTDFAYILLYRTFHR